jgi:hypothetical protein
VFHCLLRVRHYHYHLNIACIGCMSNIIIHSPRQYAAQDLDDEYEVHSNNMLL